MHVNKVNGKKYIGVAKGNPEKRWGINGNKYSLKTQPVFARAINKYTWDGFEHIIISTHLTQEEAWNLEVNLIAYYKSNCCKYRTPEYGYNMTDGGEGTTGRVMSEETKEKIRIKQLERFENPEVRENQSQLAKKRFAISENNPMYGKHHNEETKKIISNKLKLAMSDNNLRKN